MKIIIQKQSYLLIFNDIQLSPYPAVLTKTIYNVWHVYIILISFSALCQSRHGEIPDSSLQSTGSSRSSHSRSPSLHHMHEEDRPVPRRSHSHGYPHGHGHRGRLRFVRYALTSAQPHMLFLVISPLSKFWESFVNKQISSSACP